MSKIVNILGREVIDSRGYPTVETEVYTKSGYVGRTSVPSGSSVGSKEALELRDNDYNRFFGKGVLKAVDIINGVIHDALIGINVTQQHVIDNIMIDLDNTSNKSKFGANTILSVSLSVAKAAANFNNVPLYKYIAELYGISKTFIMPVPMMNIINGGKHADNNLDMQEFMIIPVGASTIRDAIRIGSEILHVLSIVLKNRDVSATLGDEGGYAPNMKSSVAVLDLIRETIEQTRYTLGKDIVLAIDCAASELFESSTHVYNMIGEHVSFSSKEFTDYLHSLIKRYPIVSIEDGHSESDWDGFVYQTEQLGKKIQLVGDDLFATNPVLLDLGIKSNIANAILIKPNQIGSLTETLEVMKIAKNAGYATIISHRSGETEDTSIADIAVGTAAGQIKIGPIRCSERVAKYNRLLRIEENLDQKGLFSGIQTIKNIDRWL